MDERTAEDTTDGGETDASASVVSLLRAAGCVFAEEEAALLTAQATDASQLHALVQRRAAGEPLEQVLGWAQFCDLRVLVDPAVFVPRRRSELLARRALAVATSGSVVVDLCCGAAPISTFLLAHVDGLEVHACDLDAAAVRCARRNLGSRGVVHHGDLFAALPVDMRGTVDVIVANAPYVPTRDLALMPAEARLHEATIALDGGTDGLTVLRRVIADAPSWLAEGGTLLFELSERQVSAAKQALAAAGLESRVIADDDLEATVIVATAARDRRPGPLPDR